MFYSVTVGRHGTTNNTPTPMARPLPSIVDQVTKSGKKAAFFTSWDGFSALHEAGNLDFNFMLNYVDEKGMPRLHVDDELTTAVSQYAPQLNSDFTFIYYGTTDSAGHAFGWMSDGYLKQIERVDQQFGKAVASLPENAVILVQADHGGHEKTHGTDMPEDVLIPWIIAGPQIRQRHQIEHQITLLDTAPTLAHFAGVPLHSQWEGDLPEEILL